MSLKRMLLKKLEQRGPQALSVFVEDMVDDYGYDSDEIEKLIDSDGDFETYDDDDITHVKSGREMDGDYWQGFSVLTKPKSGVHFIPPVEDYTDSYIKVGGKELKSTHIEMVLWAHENRENVLLVGPPGCGKTSMLRSICSNTNRSFRRFSVAGGIAVEDMVGRWTLVAGETLWMDGPLTQAVKNGWWFVCDEINAAQPDVLFILRPLLDEQRQLILTDKHGEVLEPHPEFRFFATMNPASEPYAVGTHEMNEADMDRFGVVIPMDYLSPGLETNIIIEKSGYNKKDIVEKMVRAAGMVRKMRDHSETISLISTRRLIKWAKMTIEYDLRTAYEMTIGSKLRVEEQDGIRDGIFGMF
jgi:MoxR-like ATPase